MYGGIGVSASSLHRESTDSLIVFLTCGPTYTISVEATSQHLSEESDERNITLGVSYTFPVHIDYTTELSTWSCYE